MRSVLHLKRRSLCALPAAAAAFGFAFAAAAAFAFAAATAFAFAAAAAIALATTATAVCQACGKVHPPPGLLFSRREEDIPHNLHNQPP